SALRIAFARYALSAQASRRARICSLFYLNGKQTRESVPAFVYQMSQNVNKSKKKETNAGNFSEQIS
ncbi:hypothetical protein HMPREF1581_01269, partial [Gardnerella vaginalis JCP8108]